MARRTAAQSPPRRRSNKSAVGTTPKRLSRWLKSSATKLRDVLIVLGLISAVSFLPPALTKDWPETAQRAVAISGDVRDLSVEVAHDVASGAGSLLLEAGAGLLDWGRAFVDGGDLGLAWPDLGAWLGSLEGLIPEFEGWLPEPLPAGNGGALPRVAGSFSSAKDLMYGQVYRGHRITAYCGCRFDQGRRTDLESCGMAAYAGETRADRTEAEHVFPASQYGNFRRCWREPQTFAECRRPDGDSLSGRDCCQRVDPTFQAAHNDLHNLVPAVGLVNAQRSNHNWGMAPSGETFGECDIKIDARIRRVQPPAAFQGDIARIMLYMRQTYGFRLSRQDEQLYQAWNNADPPDVWERQRNQRIERLQGIANPFVSDYQRL